MKVSFLLLGLLLAPMANATEQADLSDLISPEQLADEIMNSDEGEIIGEPTADDVVRLRVIVDKSEQRLWIYEDGVLTNSWLVSTGAEIRKCPPNNRCYFASTPTGTFTPKRMHYTYHSSLWDARMDRAIFFVGGIALHATYGDNIRLLGRKASGGCVRQSPQNADRMFRLVQYYGPKNTRITVRN